jgi:hypothetical protein
MKKHVGVIGLTGIGIVVLFVGLGACAYVFGWFAEGARVVQEQFGATASLKKYEAFKDWSAQLDAKAATLKSYQNRLKELEKSYDGRRRSEWTREDREQYNLWQQYIEGVRGSYNVLAAEYNAAMAKSNYAYANVGQLPQGARGPLQREYRIYSDE